MFEEKWKKHPLTSMPEKAPENVLIAVRWKLKSIADGRFSTAFFYLIRYLKSNKNTQCYD